VGRGGGGRGEGGQGGGEGRGGEGGGGLAVSTDRGHDDLGWQSRSITPVSRVVWYVAMNQRN
jgi:hypothetical protein